MQLNNILPKSFLKKNETEKRLYSYLIPSMFNVEIIISDYGYDGVMYTSVQADGQLGFNVAIKPESVNTKMKLILIYETSLYKKDSDYRRK